MAMRKNAACDSNLVNTVVISPQDKRKDTSLIRSVDDDCPCLDLFRARVNSIRQFVGTRQVKKGSENM